MQIDLSTEAARIVQGALHSELDAEIESNRDNRLELEQTSGPDAVLLVAEINETEARIDALLDTIRQIDGILENDN